MLKVKNLLLGGFEMLSRHILQNQRKKFGLLKSSNILSGLQRNKFIKWTYLHPKTNSNAYGCKSYRREDDEKM